MNKTCLFLIPILITLSFSSSGNASSDLTAECLLSASKQYSIPPSTVIGMVNTLKGKPNDEIGPTKDGNYLLGFLHFNSAWIVQISKEWKITEVQAYKRIKDDQCTNVAAAYWLLRKHMNKDNDFRTALGLYLSTTDTKDYKFAEKVISSLSSDDRHKYKISEDKTKNHTRNTFISLLILASFIWALIRMIKISINDLKIKVCTTCGSTSRGRYRGSAFITCILLLFFLIPGIIYSLWRSTGGRVICPVCRNHGLIPIDTPNAQKINKKSVAINHYSPNS